MGRNDILRSRLTELHFVLVFLPGLEEIKAVLRTLMACDEQSLLDVDFKTYSVHVLHSAVPLADQQAVFSRASSREQRIILATNIAETS